MLSRAVLVLPILGAVAHAAPPTVLRSTVHVTATTMHQGDWVPILDFSLLGDPSGTLTATYTKPDGSVWGSVDLVRIDAGDDRHVHTVSNMMLDPDHLSGKDTGVFKLAIAQGKDTLFTGQFKVAQIAPGKFAVDHDWITGTTQLTFEDQHEDNPGLVVLAWWKGTDCNGIDASITFAGKPLEAPVDKGTYEQLRSTGDDDAARYVQCRFAFDTVKAYVNGDYGPQPTWHVLTKHPGKYEVKLGDRTVAFTVDKSGMLARTGLVEPARRGYRMLLPTKGDVFYGNPADKAPKDHGVAALYADWKKT